MRSLVRAKIVMSGLLAIAALLGCSGTAVAGTEQDSSGNLLGYGTGLSCASPTACLSIGTDVDAKASGTKPAVERLQAGTWKSVPVRIPKGALSAMLTGVSCKSATYCLVTGETDSISGGSPYALKWDGTTLTPIAGPPVPKADTG